MTACRNLEIRVQIFKIRGSIIQGFLNWHTKVLLQQLFWSKQQGLK